MVIISLLWVLATYSIIWGGERESISWFKVQSWETVLLGTPQWYSQ